MNRNKSFWTFILVVTGLLLTLAELPADSSIATNRASAAGQNGPPIVIFPPPIPSVDGTWKISANLFSGTITFLQPAGDRSFTGEMDIDFAPDCVPRFDPPTPITGSVLNPNEFTPTTISFRRTGTLTPLTQDYTGTVIFKTVRPGFTRAVGMFGTFKQLEPPLPGIFLWYAVRD